MSLRTILDARRAKGFTAKVGVRLSEDRFLVQIAAGGIRTQPDEADFIFDGEPTIIAAAVYSGEPLTGLEKAGILEIEGDRKLAQRFTILFPLPEKLATP